MRLQRIWIFVLCLLVSCGCRLTSAQTVWMQAGSSSTPIPFLLVDASTGQIGQTGKTGAASNTPVSLTAGVGGSLTIAVFKPGGTGYVAGIGTVTELGNGVYVYQPTTTENASTGLLFINVTCSGCQTVDKFAQVVGYNINSSNLGLSLGDPWATLLTAETTAGSFGAALKAFMAASPSGWLAADTGSINSIVSGVFAHTVEASFSFQQLCEIVGAYVGGNVNTGNHTYSAIGVGNGATLRMTYSIDAFGNRTMTLSP